MSKREAALREIGELLEKLVPPDSVEVVDVDGKVHRLPTRIPARRQIEALRYLHGVLVLPASEDVKAVFSSGGSADVVVAIVGACSDSAVAEGVARAFAAAHPTACGDIDPLDLFPVEEIVAGLLPTFARSVARAGRAAKSLGAE